MRQMSLPIFGNYGFFVRFVFLQKEAFLVLVFSYCIYHSRSLRDPHDPGLMSASPHDLLCIQLIDEQNNGENNSFALGLVL